MLWYAFNHGSERALGGLKFWEQVERCAKAFDPAMKALRKDGPVLTRDDALRRMAAAEEEWREVESSCLAKRDHIASTVARGEAWLASRQEVAWGRLILRMHSADVRSALSREEVARMDRMEERYRERCYAVLVRIRDGVAGAEAEWRNEEADCLRDFGTLKSLVALAEQRGG